MEEAGDDFKRKKIDMELLYLNGQSDVTKLT
jgi:hypothetical protein